jgi:DNA-binding IclR family transcriptional regulator
MTAYPDRPAEGLATSTRATILAYLTAAHRANPEAEVSGPQLQHELDLDSATVRECVAGLARDGMVTWDPLLSNMWLRITDKGLATTERQPR